jgi:hypothetical protein
MGGNRRMTTIATDNDGLNDDGQFYSPPPFDGGGGKGGGEGGGKGSGGRGRDRGRGGGRGGGCGRRAAVAVADTTFQNFSTTDPLVQRLQK